jgi:hypothetical protein
MLGEGEHHRREETNQNGNGVADSWRGILVQPEKNQSHKMDLAVKGPARSPKTTSPGGSKRAIGRKKVHKDRVCDLRGSSGQRIG